METVQLLLLKEKEPISEPCIDSHPAHAAPVCNAVNLATVDEVLIPEGSGFDTISNGGLLSFSKVVQVQFKPLPPTSKSIGIFCAKEKILKEIKN